jgi:hypothetical protein
VEKQLQLGQNPGSLSGIYRESCLGLSGISSDALSLTTVDRLHFRSFTLFLTLPGNYERNTRHARQSFLLEVFFDDTTSVEVGGCWLAGWLAGWLAPFMSGGNCLNFPVAVEFFSCASISTLVYIRER